MSIQEINTKLRTILTQLMTINYGKEMNDNEYTSLIKYIDTVEELLKKEEIGKEQFSEIVREFSDIATDDATKSKSIAAGGFMAEDTTLGKKLEISDKIKKLSEKLIKQEEVLQEYSQRFKPEDIIERKKEEIEVNKSVIEDYKEKLSKIRAFQKGSVYKNLENALKQFLLSDTTEGLINELKNIESKIGSANDSRTKAYYDEQRKTIHNKIKDAFEGLGIQHEYSVFSNSTELQVKLNHTNINTKWSEAVKSLESELSRNAPLSLALGVDNSVGVAHLTPKQISDLFSDKLNEYTNGRRELEEENRILNQHIATIQNSIDKRDIEVPTAMARPVQPAEPTESDIKNDSRYKERKVNENILRQKEVEFGNQYDQLPMSKSKLRTRMKFLKERAEADNRKVPNAFVRFFSSVFKRKSINRDMRDQYIRKQLESYIDANMTIMKRTLKNENEATYQQQLVDYQQNEANRVQAENEKQGADVKLEQLRHKFMDDLTRGVIAQQITDEKDLGGIAGEAAQKVDPNESR